MDEKKWSHHAHQQQLPRIHSGRLHDYSWWRFILNAKNYGYIFYIWPPESSCIALHIVRPRFASSLVWVCIVWVGNKNFKNYYSPLLWSWRRCWRQQQQRHSGSWRSGWWAGASFLFCSAILQVGKLQAPAENVIWMHKYVNSIVKFY